MSYKFNERELKKSFNRYYNFYRMKRSPSKLENWTRFTLNKQTIDTIQKQGVSITYSGFKLKPYPYNPYFFYRIIWSIMKLWKWIKKTNIKLKHSFTGGFFVLLFFIIANIPKYLPNNDQEPNQEYIDTLKYKEHKIQYLQTFSDSLLTEIKQKEAIIKEFELAQKDSTLMNGND